MTSEVASESSMAPVRLSVCSYVVRSLSRESTIWVCICFYFFATKERAKCGNHNVSRALWQSGGHITSMIRSLPNVVQDGIISPFRTIPQSYLPMSNSEGESKLHEFNGGTIAALSGSESRCFVTQPFCTADITK